MTTLPIPELPTKVVQTHISVLFFHRDRVYKLHKPVKFECVNFQDREARRQDCEREVRQPTTGS